MSLPQIVLYDAHNLTNMDYHDLMGLWDIFVRSLSSRQSDKIKIRNIRWLWSWKKAQQCQSCQISFYFFPRVLCYLSITHTQLCISRHPIAVMFCVATSFWRRFICECVLSCVSVCMNIPRYECTSSKSLSDSCHNGWLPLFQLSKWLTHRWTWSAVCQRKLPQTTRAQQSRPTAVTTVTLTDLMQDWII